MKTYYECMECHWSGFEPVQAGLNYELCPECETDNLTTEEVLDVPGTIYLQRTGEAGEITWCNERINASDAEYRLITEGAEQPDNLCQQILEAVEKRGYREGWTDDQFVVRQVLKVADELGEVVEHIEMPASSYMNWVLGGVAHVAAPSADLFRSKNKDDFDCSVKVDELKAELVDVIIPAMVALATLGGSVEDIKAKALSDIERGTNYEGDDR